MTRRDPLAEIAHSLEAARRRRRQRDLRCFAALGDSFTAGTGCAPGEGWADRLATALRAVHPSLDYYNLAAEGATSAAVLEQVGPALQLEPDLVTVICGANDVLTSLRPDVEGYPGRLAEILERLRSGLPSAAILTATSPENWRFLPLRPRTRARVIDGIRRVNRATRRVAAEHGIACLDVANHPGLHHAENFSDDGLHPSAEGHERAAVELALALRAYFGIQSATTLKEER
jgi:lysophospholipase L1-like esterase